jgi:hypothetical protein
VQRYVWGGGSPGATTATTLPPAAAADPEGGSALAWSEDTVHLLATTLAVLAAFLHASLPPPTAQKIMSSHFASPDAQRARNKQNPFAPIKEGAATARAADAVAADGMTIGPSNATLGAPVAGTAGGGGDSGDSSTGSLRNGTAVAHVHSEGGISHASTSGGGGPYGGLSLHAMADAESAIDLRDAEMGGSVVQQQQQQQQQQLGSAGAIASPTRRHSAFSSVSGGTH